MNISSVLIVDDSESDRYLVRRLLKKAKLDAHVYEVSNGEEALRFFREQPPPLTDAPFEPMVVLLDINMPRLNGFEFLEAFRPVREELGYEAVVFMMFTSSEREEDRQRALRFPYVKGFITKLPETGSELRDRLAEALKP